jgi:hypothetical protein
MLRVGNNERKLANFDLMGKGPMNTIGLVVF